jgi:hypothetical protein
MLKKKQGKLAGFERLGSLCASSVFVRTKTKIAPHSAQAKNIVITSYHYGK